MNEKILVLDDEPLILTTVERALVKKGYSVSIAPDGDTFMRLLETERPNLLLMDINIEGGSSEALCDRIRVLAPEIKVIFMSGLIPDRDGIFFIEKPFTIDELRQHIRDVLDDRAKPRNPARDDV